MWPILDQKDRGEDAPGAPAIMVWDGTPLGRWSRYGSWLHRKLPVGMLAVSARHAVTPFWALIDLLVKLHFRGTGFRNGQLSGKLRCVTASYPGVIGHF